MVRETARIEPPDFSPTAAPPNLFELLRRNRLYDAVLSATPDLVYVFDLDHRFTYANRALLNMWGKSWEEAIGKNCLELGYEPWHAAMHDREIEAVIETKTPIRGEVPFEGTSGRRIYDYIFVPVFDTEGKVEAIAGTTRDITERKQHEEHQALLSNELQHRIKNTLAVIQAIAAQTFGTSGKGFQDFASRVGAMGRGMNVLTQRSWSSAPLRSLVQDVLAAHHSVNSRRIELSGPDVLVNSRSVTAFSLALNELATNATKYGALSNDEGMVLLNWQIANNRFQMTWREVRGPTVEPPLKRGFGSRLITDNLAQELGGKVEIEYPPEGVLCTIDASLDAIRTSPDNS